MEDYRTLIAGLIAGILGWLEPIAGDCFTLIYIFVLNFFFGYLADRIVAGNDFNLKKAWRCLTEAALFFLLVLSIYGIGQMKHQPEAAVQCVSTVAYIVIYFYATNILRNLKQVLKDGTPAYNVVDFLYYILSFEIIHRIPVLGNYIDKRNHDRQSSDG